MLISKGVAVGEVITIKTSAGEELLAKLVEQSDTGYKLSKPLCLTATQQGIGLTPYLFTTDIETEITLSKASIAVVAPTIKEYADTYIQQTTGIKLV